MNLRKYIFLAAALFIFPSLSYSQEAFRPIYLIGGVPLDGSTPDRISSDVKFQISFTVPLFRDIRGIRGLDLSIGYSQRSLWNVFAESSPFRDNMYIPGLYLNIPLKNEDSSLLCGIEHRSNGRDDERSRSVNCLFGEFVHTFPCGLSLSANVRSGFGWYIEDFTRDIFSKFYGYSTFGAMYEKGRFAAMASVVPVFSDRPAGTVVAEMSFTIVKGFPYHAFIQYHHGYGEAMSDCIYGYDPVPYLRAGILITPSRIRCLSL